MKTKAVLPRHIGIIMDGNRRWARAHGLPTFEGHRRGYEKMKQVGRWALDRGIQYLTVYAFSTENWKRSKAEVNYLMDLLLYAFTHDLQEYHRLGIRLRFLGRIEELAPRLRTALRQAEQLTKKNRRATFCVAINYGGQPEILDAVQRIVKQRIPPRRLTSSSFRKYLYAPQVPDLVLRTSGEQRLSGFLTWQSAYSELLFVKKHWPAFTERDLDAALKEYARRQRRYGK